MQIPSAGMIEAAVDELKSLSAKVKAEQAKELGEATPDRLNYSDFGDGYQLGLQTARIMLESNMKLQLAGIKAEDLL